MNCERIVFYRSLLDIFRQEIQLTLNNYVTNVSAYVPNSLEAPLIIRFDLNYQQLAMAEEMKSILSEILDEPLQSVKDMREAAWVYIFNLLVEKYPESSIGLQLQQIHCVIRFSDLPLNEHFEFVPFRHPVRLSLSVMKCVLHSFGDRYQCVRQSIWYCPKKCSNNQNHILAGEHACKHNCSECNGNLSEYEHRRSTYNCRMVRVFNAKCLETPIRYGEISRNVQVKLSDELCDAEMVLGQIYVLIGTYDILNQTYVAWQFQRINE
ncbi:uncharacterized protein LOC129578226 [Sitodiplosis mosellana]|uniref:uncharacterized protein LOC129578226 n=1 Tax=Sitodiplosis mosellana TaxID=263140 RepID=UPI0024439825|nr:uncharacterized protein LOC129578226 [Sitodiplosis mosellana]